MTNAQKILCIFGTRPEAIKMAPLVNQLRQTDGIEPIICVTAQHRSMLDQVLKCFDISPNFDLDIMRPGQTLSQVTTDVLQKMETVLQACKPDRVLVHGDTTTTMAAAMAAFYQHIPIGHIEAGLRTHDLASPWPEEMNRRVTDTISDLFFAPTEGARQNLLREGVDTASIKVTGNTVVDALLMMVEKLEREHKLKAEIENQFSYLDPKKHLILITGHRRENFGEGFKNLCIALNSIANRDDVELLYPVHLNPNVREPVIRLLKDHDNIHLIDPVEYTHFVYLMNRSYLIISDSGGIQEEAPSLGKPVLVTRDVTERPEAVAAGTVRMVGTDVEHIVVSTNEILDQPALYESMSKASNPFGDGRASHRIVGHLINDT